MIPRLDRYVLREMIPPFLLAIALLSLYILLNLLVLLSEFMIDRNVSWADLLRVLVYRLPELIVIALPIAVLFTVFLAFGRLVHDRELIALQTSGVSLRRVVLPVLAFGLIVSAFTFVLNDQVTPWGTQQYQRLLRQLLVRGAVPQIQDNTVFKDGANRFFYVRRYNRESGLLEDVLLFDPNGQTYLPELSGPFPQLITAQEARWEETRWVLQDGTAHLFDENGGLSYRADFETLTIQVGDTIQNLFVEQRQPREMSLAELAERINTFQVAGQPVSELVVEYQIKLVVPLSALIYALFAAPLSLCFGFRGRAAGIIVSVLLTGAFQGAFFYAQTLARRELLDPVWGPWLPNACFGALGVLLLLNVDRLSRLELGRWFQRTAVSLLLLGAWAAPALAQEAPAEAEPAPPIEISAQAIELALDGRSWLAQGEVVARYGEQTLSARELQLAPLADGRWQLRAQGQVVLEDPSLSGRADALQAELEAAEDFRPSRIVLEAFSVQTHGELGELRYRADRGELRFDGETVAAELSGAATVEAEGMVLQAQRLSLAPGAEGWRVAAEGAVRFEGQDQTVRGTRLALELTAVDGGLWPQSVALEAFSGEGTFVNALGETHPIRYEGQSARFAFEGERLARMDLEQGLFTTCTCSEAVGNASYSFSGRALTVWPDEWLLGQDIAFRASGVPLFWLPVIFAPLQELDFEGSEFLPEVGRDALRGWFARWRLPVFADPGNRGTFRLDYYHRHTEVGMGLDWQYTLPVQSQSGTLSAYRLVGAGERLELSWQHRWPISRLAELDWSLNRRDVRPAEAAPSRWAYDLNLAGGWAGWRWQARTTREETVQQEAPDGEEEPLFQVLERLPELTLSHAGQWADGPLRTSGQLGWGRFREQAGAGDPFVQRERLDVSGQIGTTPLRVQSAGLQIGLGANARTSLYGAPEGASARTSLQFQADARWTPLAELSATGNYVWRSVAGTSPFAFDTVSVADHLGVQLQLARGGFQGALSGGYGFQTGRFDPASLQFGGRFGALSLSGTVRTPPDAWLPERVQVQARWTAGWGQLALEGGYRVAANASDDLVVKAAPADEVVAGLGLSGVQFGLRFDPNALSVRRTNAEFQWRLGAWSLDFHGEFDWPSGRFSALQAGIVHHFCHDCWQAGVVLSDQRVWLEVQINAFPGAGLNYSPTDGQLRFD